MDKRLPLSSEPDSARASGFFLCEALRGRPRCITPPLSSVSSSEPSSPFVPGPDVCIIDLASTASSPAPSPVQQLQSRLRDGHLDSDITVPATVIITSPPPICPDHELNYDSAADLAVDIPLSSVVSDPLSANEALNAIQLPVLEDSSDLISHEELRGEDFDDALLAILNSRHSQLSTALDQEQLCPYDTISRLPLPLVDIGIPKAQWALNWTARQHLSELRSFMPMRLLVPCIPQDSLLDSELKWYEALEDPPKTLQSIDNIRTSSPTIMKPAEDPELDWSGDSPFASDDDSVESLTTGTDIQRLSSVVPRSAFPLPTGFQAVRQGQGLDAKSSPNHLDVSSTTRLLDDFMALRAIKRPRLSGAGTLSSDPTLRAAQSLLPATHHRQESIPPTPQELRRAPKPAFEILRSKRTLHCVTGTRSVHYSPLGILLAAGTVD
ncbi:hypothetical protein ACCO45_002501 [Purpureocillium lilacinum]|uniref:Uncharacterized protein n=1 Tax=Purpureocillium lilacinum TaxID=33203 RepID=A0ACC4EA87_PURLI